MEPLVYAAVFSLTTIFEAFRVMDAQELEVSLLDVEIDNIPPPYSVSGAFPTAMLSS